ncbi:hypothetical protein ACQY0O_001588 [Thecaphora frezii]
MRLVKAACVCVAAAATAVFAWETREQAASQAYDLVYDAHIYGVATLSTKYADNATDPFLRGQVISGPEYFAPCFPSEGDLLFLGLKVSQTWRNVLTSAQKNATVSIASNADPAVPDRRHRSHSDGPGPHWDPERPRWRRGMPSKGRATLFGHFELLDGAAAAAHDRDALARCYLSHHPDAKHWAPGARESPHIPFWAKFVVERIYWVGGFGDEHFIGWIGRDQWKRTWRERAAEAAQHGTDDPEGAESIVWPGRDRQILHLFAEDGEEPAELLFQM